MGWKAIAKSAIGTKYKKINSPLQDDGYYYVTEDKQIIIGAVSDGAGSATHSTIGAELAVINSINFLKDWINFLEENNPDYDWKIPIDEKEATQVFIKVISDVVNILQTKATEQKWRFKDLACTLLLFVATPEWLTAMQIGDGFIVMRSLDSPDYELLFVSDKGEYANETTFITSSRVLQKMQVRVIEAPPEFIFASTDGLENLAIVYQDRKPYDKFFKPFEAGIKNNDNIDEEAKSIAQWLRSEQVNQRTDDDKTILVCYYDDGDSVSDTQKQKKTTEKDVQKTHTPSREKYPKKIEDREQTILIAQNFIVCMLVGILWNQQYHYSFVDTNPPKGFLSALRMWLFLVLCLGLFEAINLQRINFFQTNKINSIITLIVWTILALVTGGCIYHII